MLGVCAYISRQMFDCIYVYVYEREYYIKNKGCTSFRREQLRLNTQSSRVTSHYFTFRLMSHGQFGAVSQLSLRPVKICRKIYFGTGYIYSNLGLSMDRLIYFFSLMCLPIIP